MIGRQRSFVSDEGKSMKKIAIKLSVMAASLLIILLYGNKAEAAVKTMPDGGLFDPSFYAATYDDVYRAFGMNEALLYQHYLLCGVKEKRLPYAGYVYPEQNSETVKVSDTLLTMPDGTKFDPVYYAAHNPDVVAFWGLAPMNLYTHYLVYGLEEGRAPYEGYVASELKLSFSSIGAIADVRNPEDLVRALRLAGRYKVGNLKILAHFNGGLSSETVTMLCAGQAAYIKNLFGATYTVSKPLVYGDTRDLIVEVNITMKFR